MMRVVVRGLSYMLVSTSRVCMCAARSTQAPIIEASVYNALFFIWACWGFILHTRTRIE